MEEIKMKYLSPVTVETKIFLDNFETLTKTYNNVDMELVCSLQKVMNAIENFLDSAPNEIVETKHTELVKFDNVKQIDRMFYCTVCNKNISRSAEKTALHLTEDCTMNSNDEEIKDEYCDSVELVAEPKRKTLPATPLQKLTTVTKNPYRDQSTKLKEKTLSLLTCDLFELMEKEFEIAKSLKFLPFYDKIVNELLDAIRPSFYNMRIQVYKFGSRIAGIGQLNSVLNLYVDIGNTFHDYPRYFTDDATRKMIEVRSILRLDDIHWKGVISVDTAPILKLLHTTTGIECDIHFSNSLGAMNTNLLDYLFCIQPMAALLTLYLKKLVDSLQLNFEINSYILSWLVIFYLQTLDLLPSIEQLQENINRARTIQIGPWICTYNTPTLKDLSIPLVDKDYFVEYLMGFLSFYVKFNYEKDFICPYLGVVTKKDDLERSMPGRYSCFAKHFKPDIIASEKSFVVQDPIELVKNIAKDVSLKTFRSFTSLISKSLVTLSLQYPESD